MLPISLTIQGLYSYLEKQHIDFDKLLGANIFGIFGHVGSGKSAILEALTFALYGKTDRLNLSGDNRYYNMMNLKSDELSIEFVFQAGQDEQQYKVMVRGKRNKKNFEEVKALERTAYKKKDNGWEPIDPETLEDIIGLNYDNFRRTIIIPQGKFQEFLQLSDKDRTQMMKELFHLEKFELYYQVAELEKVNNEKLQKLDGQLKMLLDASREGIQDLMKQKDELQKQMKLLNNAMAELRIKEKEFNQLKDLYRRIADAENQLKILKQKEEYYQKLQKEIREYEYCLLTFKSHIDHYNEIEKNILNLNKELKNSRDLLQEKKIVLNNKTNEFQIIQKKYENRNEINQQIDELRKIYSANDLKARNREAIKKVEDYVKVLEREKQQIQSLKDSLKDIRLKIEILKKEMPDTESLSKVKDWHVKMKNLLEKKEDKENELNSFKAKMDKSREESANIRELFSDLEEISLSDNEEIMLLRMEELKKQLSLTIEEFQNKTDHLLVQQKLHDYADEIKDGEPCPLCGSTEHPSILNIENVDKELLTVRQQKRAKDDLNKKLNDSILYLKGWIRQNEENKLELEKKNKGLKDIIKEIEVHKALFNWKDFEGSSLQSIEESLDKASKDQKQIDVLDRKKLEIEQKSDDYSVKREQLAIDLQKEQFMIKENDGKIEALLAELQILKYSDYERSSKEELRFKADALKKDFTDIEENYKQADSLLKNLNIEIAGIESKISIREPELAEQEKKKAAISAKLEEILQKSHYNDLEDVLKVLGKEFNTESLKPDVEKYFSELSSLNNQLERLYKDRSDKLYDADEHGKLEESIKAADEEIGSGNIKLGGIQNSLSAMEIRLKNKMELEAEREKLNLRGTDIAFLKGLFRGSGFVNYISSIYLQNLCAAANERFYKLTRQSLSLELTGDNNFEVRDYLNGGKTRSVKTLSGGQTFQAALSLALSLAGSIRGINDSGRNFFFLDEGFGTLDKDSLDIVFDTLKSLRKENRIVGVISHVDDMQQEIETYLRVTNDPERGSLIEASWN